MKELEYNIAEHFFSLQGEGALTGTPMAFIRLAGCNVGEYRPIDPAVLWADWPNSDEFTAASQKKPEALRVLHPMHSICTTALGQEFLCDTDYHMRYKMTVTEIVEYAATCGAKWVCLTGGEPLMVNVIPLIAKLVKNGIKVQIETSGTVRFPEELSMDDAIDQAVYVTCSPKKGFKEGNVPRIDEFKFVVNFAYTEHLKLEHADQVTIIEIQKISALADSDVPIFVQAANHVNTIDDIATQAAMEFVKRHAHANLRLSAQFHKYLHIS